MPSYFTPKRVIRSPIPATFRSIIGARLRPDASGVPA